MREQSYAMVSRRQPISGRAALITETAVNYRVHLNREPCMNWLTGSLMDGADSFLRT